MATKVNLISLGCSKNLVDSEQMIAELVKNGIIICENVQDSDVAIVNTCGFIDSAKKEAIDNILDLVHLKKEGIITGIVVVGCLTERYRNDFLEELPEVDAIMGTASHTMIVEAVCKAIQNEQTSFFNDVNDTELELERVVSTQGHTAFLKISEGCNNACSFCIIPKLRGKYRSRSIENIVKEAKNLAKMGTKELIIIAQDVTRYGKDLYKEYKLVELLAELERIDGIEWIRLHYLYPELVDDKLIDFIAESGKIVNYFDMPMQHINDRILKLMRRRGSREYLTGLVEKIRSKIPDAVIRTSLIVGLPSETDDDFNELCEFLVEAKMERAGVFAFSREENTEAYDMPDQVDEDVKLSRQKIAEEIQSRIIDEYNETQIGKTFKVLVDSFDEEFSMFEARTYADSLDIDSKVYIDLNDKISVGDFVYVEITDLFGPYLKGNLK